MYPAENTTPESYEIIKYMDEMVKKDIHYMVMEVSSQALKYDRVNDNYSLICENCFKEKVAECPCCGKPFFVESSKRVYMLTQPGTEFNTNELKFKSYYDWHYDPERFEQNFETIKPICVCQNCATKMGVSDFKEYRYKDDSYWIGTRAVHFRLAPYRPEGYEKYLKSNLKTLEPQDGLILTPYEDVYDY